MNMTKDSPTNIARDNVNFSFVGKKRMQALKK
jgi:hypothetical protein